MKVESITITGMHKVDKKTYNLNDGITYFIGENGAGKSTILEAIQLALLGYIPGYNKQNEAIMKHASGPVMCVEATLEGGIKITRSWNRSGSSVQSHLDVAGYNGDIADLIGEVQLPVFDFNEFKSMTANKLKEWFIEFLPASTDDLDIMKELKEAVGQRVILSDELLDDIKSWIDNSHLEGLSLVKGLNTKFKEDQSYVKGQIAKLEGTIQSLIRYDDAVDLDEDEIRDEIGKLDVLKNEVMRYAAESGLRNKTLADIESLKAHLPAASIDEDPEIKDFKAQIEELTKKNEVLKADYDDLQAQITSLQRDKSLLPKAGATCPYTNERCETAASLAAAAEATLAQLDEQIAFKQEELKDCDSSVRSENDRKILQLSAELGARQSNYDRLASMEIQLKNSSDLTEPPSDMTVEQLDAKLSELRDQLVQIGANKRYDELNETITADKFKLENELEIYKIWAKLTDANGLQTQLMNTPFENLADEMSTYLTQMFNADTKASFNLQAKANSFSFGLERDGRYIEFDYLSSGERCLFTLALIMCILDKSNSEIRTILIDDILDHLDTSNSSYLFEALKNVKNIQFILAGVKECDDSSICIPVQ